AAFDIRWLGAVHAALCLAAFGVLLAGLRGRGWRVQAALAVLPLLVFTDVCYTAYLNSFFMDAAALCGLLLMAASGISLQACPSERRPGSAAPLCVFSVAALLIARGIQWKPRRWRALAWSAAGLVLLAGAGMLASTDGSYRGQAMFNVLFFRLGPAGADLEALG